MASDTPPNQDELTAVAAATRAADQLGLHVVRLSSATIQAEALALVPESLAREYRLIPTALNQASKQLTVALADATLLAKPAPAFLQELKAKGYALTLVITPTTDFEAALAAYAKPSQTPAATTPPTPSSTNAPTPPPATTPVDPKSQPTSPAASVAESPSASAPAESTEKVPASVRSQQVPSVSLAGRDIPLEVLERFPEDVASKYQMVVYELSPDGKTASVAVVNPNDRRVREILKFVQERNGIRINVFATTKADLDEALKGYKRAAAAVQAGDTAVPRQPEPAQPAQAVQAKATTPAIADTPTPKATPNVPAPAVSQDIPLRRASVDQVKQAVKEPVASVAAPSVSPTVAVPPVPVAGGAPTPGQKIGGLSPVVNAAEYQRAVTRNSQNAPVQPVVTQITANDIQTSGGEVGQPAFGQAALETIVEERNLDTILGGVIQDTASLETVVKSGMVPRIVAAFISYAVSSSASDIHLESSREYVRLRYRIDGELREIVRLPTGLLAPLVSRLKILAKLKIDESRVPQDGRFDVLAAGHEIDLRVSTLPTVHGEKVVLRILDKSSGLRKLEELGLQGTNLARVRGVLDDPYGIVLVTGPTGSGKTSTLYAMLSELNTAGVNIVTLEDPVEYQLEGINQTQVRPAIGFGFADGLRSILRQDPNIIMVGEIRDKQTAALATQAALTGHLVLTTLHTNDAAGAIPRMLDMGIEPFLLASSLKAVVGQRLVRRLVPEGKVAADVPSETLEAVKSELARGKAPEVVDAAASAMKFYGPGSNGFKGRTGIYEVLTMSESIAQLALKKAAASEIAQAALAEGMVTMRQDGILKALAGQSSLDEVLQATSEK